jgi:hypothetical protein
MTKTNINLVPPPTKPSAPFGEVGQKLWNTIESEYSNLDAGNQELLRLACLAADRADAMRQQIDRDGEIVQTVSGPKEHPLLKAELANSAFVARTLARLLPASAPKKAPGRPGSINNWLGPHSK